MIETAVLKDMHKSLSKVKDKIKPILENMLSGWHLVQVEGENNKACKLLDMSCGIDYLLCSNKCVNVYGVASRVQYSDNYRTFTVRKSRESGELTEYDKRVQAIHKKALYPYYTLQAYVVADTVSGLAITPTEDLIDFIKKGYAEEKRTQGDLTGQAKFYVCKWDSMKYCGYKVLEYTTPDKTTEEPEKHSIIGVIS